MLFIVLDLPVAYYVIGMLPVLAVAFVVQATRTVRVTTWLRRHPALAHRCDQPPQESVPQVLGEAFGPL